MSSHRFFLQVLVDCMSARLHSRIDADGWRQHVWECERTTAREGARARVNGLTLCYIKYNII